MFVKSIVLDGFKSYGKRTEINGFDPSFNAITGLNGSGKSNILDAICFVLGITNLSYVRAVSMQDFVYKQGQANINKASVSVTFDNRDKSQCPPGFEDQDEITITRQVVIGGKNKYQINGLNVQNNRVQDLFRSVQLNVNNPHFLIMQGRITKVLNMKPLEILSMVEEAAGTRLYKSKKEQSMKLLEKKDAKMEEINNQLHNELEPKIAKLREERQQYQELLKLNREFDQIARVVLAFRFFQAKKQCASVEEELQKVTNEIQSINQAVTDGEQETVTLQSAIKEMQEQKDQEGGSQLKQCEKELHVAEKSHAQLLAKVKEDENNLKAETRRRQQVLKNITTDQGLLKNKEISLEKGREEYTSREGESQKLQAALESARKRHQAASMGLFVDEQGNASSLQQQLIDAQKAMINAKSETNTLQMIMNRSKKDLKVKSDELKKCGNLLGNEQSQLNKLEKSIANLQTELSTLEAPVAQHKEFSARFNTLTNDIRKFEQQINSQLNNYPRAKFVFTDPEPNFDRRSVKGLVCRLIKMQDKNMAPALEMVAGSKLYNVITQDDKAAQKLIKYKCVAQRVTYMPLNKVTSYTLRPDVIANAKAISGNDNVWYALDLIEFDQELLPAMKAVFGSTLVCRDLKTAKILAFDPRVKARCVTLDGDVVEPAGTMSGGAPSRSTPILSVLAGLQTQQEKLEAAQAEVNQLRRELPRLETAVERYNVISAEHENKNHEVQLLRSQIDQSPSGRVELEVKELEKEIEKNSCRLQELQDIERKATQQHKELEQKVRQSKSLADKEMKASDKEMKQLQAEIDKGREQWEQCEQKFKTLELEIEEMKTTIAAAENDSKTSETAIEQMKNALEEMNQNLAASAEQVKELQIAVQKRKDIINKHNREMQAKVSRCEQLHKEILEHGLTLKRLANNKEQVTKECKNSSKLVSQMQSQHEWIQGEQQHFNQPGTIYDFGNIPMDKLKDNMAAIESRKKTLEKKTNTQAMHILAKSEEQLKDLLKKKSVVEKDREQLRTVINELDIKMVEELEKAYKKINKAFGSIFSNLLKGADAELVCSSESGSVLDGLEVKVGFNGKWKDSLGELSGGQRSLVALSLILAMLLFKPAPIYILDEVDAALDPSHTENIGTIIQTHFKQSQFIIVSLKEGMFSNANVLFRTKFVDGMSTVSSTKQAQKK